MRKFLLIILFFFFLSSVLPLSSQWAKTYGGNQDESYDWFAPSIRTAKNGGYFIAGTSYSFIEGYSGKIWVFKISPQGEIEWEYIYGEGHTIVSMQNTLDSGCVVCCGDIILKISADGTLQWQRGFRSESTYGHLVFIQQTKDEGYLALVEDESSGPFGPSWFHLIKLGSDGKDEWARSYRNGQVGYLLTTADGGFIVSSNSIILKISSYGAIEWQKDYSGHSWIVQNTDDGGYVLASFEESYDGIVIKINSEGDIEWKKTYKSNTYNLLAFRSIQQDTDGSYFVAGYVRYYFENSKSFVRNILALKIVPTGTIEWQKVLKSLNESSSTSAQKTSNEGYMVCGVTSDAGAGGADLVVLNISSKGEISSCTKFIDSDILVSDSNINSENSNITVTSSKAYTYPISNNTRQATRGLRHRSGYWGLTSVGGRDIVVTSLQYGGPPWISDNSKLAVSPSLNRFG